MKYTLKKQPQSTLIIEVNLDKQEIAVAYQKALEALVAEVELPGFRKGKAPIDMAAKHIAKDRVYDRLIKDVVPAHYQEIVEKESIKPIASPRIKLVSAKENEDWKMEFEIALMPAVKLNNYKERVKEAVKKAIEPELWVPGKDEKAPPEQTEQQKRTKKVNSALDAVLKEISCDVPPLLIDTELERRLSQIADDVRKLGLTVEKYLESKKLSIEQLKEQMKKEITEMYVLEFALEEIAQQEKIAVEAAEIEKLFAGIEKPEEKKAAQANAYWYASVLKKQKTIDFIIGL